MSKQKRDASHIGSKIPYILKVRIESAVSNGSYLNVSEFVRNAVKEKLFREGFLPILSTDGT
jgi:Arc/MetJ-type ribon-helix-helix transcriptional regulator